MRRLNNYILNSRRTLTFIFAVDSVIFVLGLGFWLTH